MTSGHAGATPRLPVAVLGSLNTDLVVQVARLPRPGETAQGGDLRRLPGGKGANQAVAAGRLGAYVELIGAIGDDDLGAELVRGLVAEDVGVDAVTVIPSRSSGVALIVVDGGGENTVTVAPGANADVDRAHPTAAWGLIAAATVLVLQLQVPAEASLAAAELAHRARKLVVLNAAPLAHPVPPTILALAHECDVVVVNEEEAATLAQADAASPHRLVVTLGARGARWSDDGVTGSFPAYKVQAVDTVGAGDTFVAAVASLSPMVLTWRKPSGAAAPPGRWRRRPLALKRRCPHGRS